MVVQVLAGVGLRAHGDLRSLTTECEVYCELKVGAYTGRTQTMHGGSPEWQEEVWMPGVLARPGKATHARHRTTHSHIPPTCTGTCTCTARWHAHVAHGHGGAPRCSPRQRHPLNILGGSRAGAGVLGTPTFIPQNDPLAALIILNTDMWGL